MSPRRRATTTDSLEARLRSTRPLPVSNGCYLEWLNVSVGVLINTVPLAELRVTKDMKIADVRPLDRKSTRLNSSHWE